jgi:hypothetical protein
MKTKSRLRMSLIGAGTVVGEAVFLICHGGRRHCVVTLQALGPTPCGLLNCPTDTVRAQERLGMGGVWLTSVSPATTWR